MRLNWQESAEVIVPLLDDVEEGEGPNIRTGKLAMSSRGGRRQSKIPGGSYPREEAVKPRGTMGVPSSSPAQVEEQPYGDGTELMEKVVERSNMLRALRRVESNCQSAI